MSSSLSISSAPAANAANTTGVPEGRSTSLSHPGRHAALLLGPAFGSASQALSTAGGRVTELEPHWAAAIEAATD